MPDDAESLEVDGAAVPISHPDRLLYPDDGLTKRDVARYYAAVAPHLLRHAAGRPVALVRFPEGVGGERFFQKNRPAGVPASVGVAPVGRSRFSVVTDAAGLVGLANFAALELHGLLGRMPHPERPDLLVFDLDPPEGAPFTSVAGIALRVRDHLSHHGYAPYVKTSGVKGAHVVAPLVAGTDPARALEAAKDLARSFGARNRGAVTTAVRKSDRRGRLFLDVQRHQPEQLLVVPYSLRGRPGAPVSTPVTWAELEALTDPAVFNLRTVPDRLARTGDPWARIADDAVPLHPDR